MQPTVILGSGGHAKVTIEILREGGLFDPVGCVAHEASGPTAILGVPVLGLDDCLPELLQSGISYAFVAVGDNRLRQKLIRHVVAMGYELASAVSPTATISPSARLGSGIAILPGANVGPDTVVDNGVIINSGASVDHDGSLGECCHVGPGTTLAGRVTVGELAFVATGSSVIPGITIGTGSLVGAGSVVVRDIEAQVIAYGCPARTQGPVDAPVATPHETNAEAETATPRTLRLVV